MPTYLYCCKSCGESFELKRPVSEAGEAARCPKCDAEAEKKLSSFTFTMK